MDITFIGGICWLITLFCLSVSTNILQSMLQDNKSFWAGMLVGDLRWSFWILILFIITKKH